MEDVYLFEPMEVNKYRESLTLRSVRNQTTVTRT